MIGQTVGAYRITHKLGEGGMGAVYYGEHTTLARPAAIKVLLPQYSMNSEVVNRFFNEARATGMIRHPGLVDVLDYGQLPTGSAYIVMEFLDGESLSARIKREKTLSSDTLLNIGRQIAQALGAAHSKHIVHRDLKPDNVHLVPDEEVAFGTRVKVLDFGIAKLTDVNDPGGVHTSTSAVMGTPMYMSPEQCRGAGMVDHRSDIYSLGCILYEMACGRPPFTGAVGDLFIGHMRDDPTPPIERNQAVPHFLNDLILWTLRKSPEVRPQTMAELVAAIDSQIGRPVSGRFDHARQSSPRHNPATIPEMTPPYPDTPPSGVHGQQTIAFDATNPAYPTSTTLSGAAAEATPSPVARGGSSAKIIAGAFFGVLLLGGGYAALRKKSDVTAPTPVATTPVSTPIEVAPPPKPVPVEEPKPVVAPAPAPAPAPAKVALHIDSEPSGAEVFRAADGLRLGTTPLDYRIDASVGTLPFIVKLDGYNDERVELDANHDATKAITMKKKSSSSSRSKTGKPTNTSGPRKVLVDDPFQ